MDGLQRGIRIVHQLDLGSGPLKIRMARPFFAGGPRLRLSAQPILEHLEIGILSHQVMEGRTARANQTADHDRPLDSPLENFRRFPPLLFRAQSLDENFQRHLSSHRRAVGVEAGLVLVAVEQHPQTLEIGGIAEIIRTGDARRFFV